MNRRLSSTRLGIGEKSIGSDERRYMAESKFQLRCYSYLDRMQPQYAAFVGTITQGDLPVEGMASLYIEVAPGNEVFQLVDIAVKSTEARPGAQIVEREFGMFEVHSRSQAEVLEAGRIVLDRLGLKPEDRLKPEIASVQVITNVDPYQAQLAQPLPPRQHVGARRDDARARMRAGRLHQLRLQRGGEGRIDQAAARLLGRALWPHVDVRLRGGNSRRAQRGGAGD
jgi:hypothetical protein